MTLEDISIFPECKKSGLRDFLFFFQSSQRVVPDMPWFLPSWFPSPVVLVAVGGALGSVLRYGVGRLLVASSDRIPLIWGTGLVNLVGSFVLGCVMAGFGATHRGNPGVLLLGVGLCGGFTTFSTLAMELAELIDARRWDLALAYGLSSLVGGWLAFVAGAWLAQRLVHS